MFRAAHPWKRIYFMVERSTYRPAPFHLAPKALIIDVNANIAADKKSMESAAATKPGSASSGPELRSHCGVNRQTVVFLISLSSSALVTAPGTGGASAAPLAGSFCRDLRPAPRRPLCKAIEPGN